jgi:hypothetical protein
MFNETQGWAMKKLSLITLFLASAAASTAAWSDTETIDFEGVIEEFDVGSNGLPTRIETQGYTFYSSGGLAIGTSGSSYLAWCPAPGCEIRLYGGGLHKLVSLDVAAPEPFPGSGTIGVEGNFWDDPDRLDPSVAVLPFSSSWTTHTFDDDWQYPHSLEWLEINIQTTTGGIVALDNIVIDTGRWDVEIDVLPGDEANMVYPNKSGKLPIAILSSAEFDATQVYVPGLKINQQENVAELVGVENVDGLYGPDLVTQFGVQRSAIFCDDTEVSITGYTNSGESISGVGAIDATQCETGGCHAY